VADCLSVCTVPTAQPHKGHSAKPLKAMSARLGLGGATRGVLLTFLPTV
jgi:hypothetical protein